jgi:hypothetical protein
MDSNKTEDILDTSLEQRKKKRISLGSLSKVFSRGKTRRSLAMSCEETDGSSLQIYLDLHFYILNFSCPFLFCF